MASSGERTLVIGQLSAQFEKDKDLIGAQDVYFVLGLYSDAVKTSVIKNGGLNPVWKPDEAYRCHDRGQSPDLIVRGFNKNTILKDTALGEGKIPMVELGKGGTHTVPLFDKKGTPTGTLTFSSRESQPGSFTEPPAKTSQTTPAAVPPATTSSNRTTNDPNRTVTETRDSNVNDGGELAPGQKEVTRSVKTTEDTDLNESSEYHATGAAARKDLGPIPDLASSDEHWEKSLAAAEEARKQAKIVEAGTQKAHEDMLAAQDATHDFEAARRQHSAIQEKLAALDLDARRAEFDRKTKAYEDAKGVAAGVAADATSAQQTADALRQQVNEKGEALDAEVQQTKLHQSRLAELEAELERLRGAHGAAQKNHDDVVAAMDPKKKEHASLTEKFQSIRSAVAGYQQRRATLEAKERELQSQLATHNSELGSTQEDLDEFEAMAVKRKEAVDDATRDREAAEGDLAGVTATLAEHRKAIGELKQDTEARLADAEKAKEQAASKEAAVAEGQGGLGDKEAEAGRLQQEVVATEQAVQPLHEKIRKETTIVDSEKSSVEELHRKLGAAKQDLDLAQARKEELWEKAKYHGEQADKASDDHYLFAHNTLGKVASNVGVADPKSLTSQGAPTTGVLEKAGEKIGLN